MFEFKKKIEQNPKDPFASKRRILDPESEDAKSMFKKFGDLPQDMQGEILASIDEQKKLKPMSPKDIVELLDNLILQKHNEMQQLSKPERSRNQLEDSMVKKFDEMTASESDRNFKPKLSREAEEINKETDGYEFSAALRSNIIEAGRTDLLVDQIIKELEAMMVKNKPRIGINKYKN